MVIISDNESSEGFKTSVAKVQVDYQTKKQKEVGRV